MVPMNGETLEYDARILKGLGAVGEGALMIKNVRYPDASMHDGRELLDPVLWSQERNVSGGLPVRHFSAGLTIPSTLRTLLDAARHEHGHSPWGCRSPSLSYGASHLSHGSVQHPYSLELLSHPNGFGIGRIKAMKVPDYVRRANSYQGAARDSRLGRRDHPRK